MLQHDDSCDAGDEEPAQGGNRSAPKKADRCRENEGNEGSDPVNVSVLPDNEPIALQIRNVIKWRKRFQFEHQPADVRVKKPFADVVRILLLVDVLMMRSMFAGPEKNGILEGARTKKEGQQSNSPMCLKSAMGVEPMVTESDAKSARDKHREEQRHLEPINPEKVNVNGNSGDREKKGADKKGARRPIYFIEGNT